MKLFSMKLSKDPCISLDLNSLGVLPFSLQLYFGFRSTNREYAPHPKTFDKYSLLVHGFMGTGVQVFMGSEYRVLRIRGQGTGGKKIFLVGLILKLYARLKRESPTMNVSLFLIYPFFHSVMGEIYHCFLNMRKIRRFIMKFSGFRSEPCT